jgi:multiple antibiotic resistance protein
MTEFVLNAFVVLFVVIDPVGVAPIFGALTQGTSEKYRLHIAIKGTTIAAAILLVFSFTGHYLLNALGISLDAFRIAGGVFLFLLSIDMVFARQSGLRSTTESEQVEAVTRQDISVFPLAIPLLAGPGAMTTLILKMGEASGEPMHMAAIIGVLIGVLFMAFLALIFAARIMRLMGETGSNVISRVLGILLAALAIQFIIDGIYGSFMGT